MPLGHGTDTIEEAPMLLGLDESALKLLDTGELLLLMLCEDPTAAYVEVGVAVVVTVTAAGDEAEHDAVTVSVEA